MHITRRDSKWGFHGDSAQRDPEELKFLWAEVFIPSGTLLVSG